MEDIMKSAEDELKIRGYKQGSVEWQKERRMRLTASAFGEVCKRRPYTSCKKLVKRLLYAPKSKATRDMEDGHCLEQEAKEKLRESGVNVEDCGLFIDRQLPFLGASPDGLIAEDTILEIKSPGEKARAFPSAKEAIQSKTKDYLSVNEDGELRLKKNHDFYFQIQGQLHITGRSKCMFHVYSKNWQHTELIERDDQFWAEKMEQQLVT
ncbi:hypothetical protein ONE63_011354 [Megalurothrips usitatus]|uniref:YqaJ viral recombinase domain-containing protein n=1 Tax=Megalurothrips usitatus TaxID=439358 RepID=A0AAV7X3W6_9NEOP|nr:hypothetical protein ONE63_011354 [Megalurothrips usitatus]